MSTNDVNPSLSAPIFKNNDKPIVLPGFFLDLGNEAVDFLDKLDKAESLWRSEHWEEAAPLDQALMEIGLHCLCRVSKTLREWRVVAYMGFPFILSLTWNLCLTSAKKEQPKFPNRGYDAGFFEVKEVLALADGILVDLFEDLCWLQKRVMRHRLKLV